MSGTLNPVGPLRGTRRAERIYPSHHGNTVLTA